MKYSASAIARFFEESPPSRGAWIEIPVIGVLGLLVSVAPLAGGVD